MISHLIEAVMGASDDTAYMAAVEAGDVATCQEMVDSAARTAGYTVEAYHGGPVGIKEFDVVGRFGIGAFFSPNPKVAEKYVRRAGPRGKLYRVYVSSRLAAGKDRERLHKAAHVEDADAEDRYNSYKRVFGEAGFDGVSLSTMQEVIVYTPSAIKLADPITYDDSHNPIPLSQRFNPSSNDIRY